MIDYMLEAVSGFINAILSFLPHSPFRAFITSFQSNATIQQYLGYINWLCPVGQAVPILAAWLVAISLFNLYSVIMRWAKLIGD